MSRYRNQLIQVSSFTNFAGEVSVWDIGTNRKRLRLALPQQVDSVALSPDGKLLATGNGSWFCPLARPAVWRNEVRIYDIGTGGLRRQLSLNDGSSRIPVAFSPSGKGLVTGNGNTNAAEAVIAWNMRTGTKAWAWTEQKSPLSLAFSPDGSTVASGNGEGRITLIKGQTGQLRGYIGASAFGIWGLAFSSDSKRLASGADEAMIKIWDLPP